MTPLSGLAIGEVSYVIEEVVWPEVELSRTGDILFHFVSK